MKRWLSALAVLWSLPAAARPPMELPVYLEESHAGTFYYLAATLPLDEPHTLILVDAHTDASGIAASDEVRAAIRRGPTREQQFELFAKWRERGRIQCFDWLEPLMPAPVSEVFWVSAPLLPEPQRAELERTACEQLDGHHEALPRDCGLLAEKYHALDLRALEHESARWPESRAVVASVDLDYFAAVPPERLEAAVHQVLAPILRLRGLRALTFCVSSPWQPSREHAEQIVFLALDYVLRVPRARLRFEPFARCGPDKSLKAQEFSARGEQVPVFDLSRCGPALRSLLATHWRAEMTLIEPAEMEKFAGLCRSDPFLPHVTLPGRLTASDGDWQVDAGELEKLAFTVQPETTGGEVRWQALTPEGARAQMMAGPYAEGAPRWLPWALQPLGTGTALPLQRLRPLLHSGMACGTVKLRAEVVRDGESRFSAPVTLRVRAAGTQGVRAALSGQFGLPYIFGSTFLRATASDGTTRSGAECGEGADCANFLSAALRADGWLTPWGDVTGLCRALTPLPAGHRLPADAAMRGLVLSFGPHAAMLWEDRAPLGELNDDDLCVHQLEGTPEILTLGKLREGRPVPRLFEPARSADAAPRVIFGGDVMLARTVGTRLAKGEPVLAPLRDYFAGATAVVNLECAIPAGEGKGFSAPPAAAAALKAAGVSAVSLANNHAGDAGAAGLAETAGALRAAGVSAFGHSPEAVPLAVPGSVTFSLLGWDENGTLSAAEMAAKIRSVENAIVFAHWGLEHSRTPTPGQRAAARLFIEAGARMVIGSGPHAVQPLEWMNGAPVAWSLGNLVFDDRGPDAEWRRGALLEVWLTPGGGITRCRLREVPVTGGPQGE